jgi:Recombinase
VSGDATALWNAPETTAADRKQVVRLLIERVVVHIRPDSQRVEVTISWRGGLMTHYEIERSVSRYESLSDYDRLMDRVFELREDGLTIKEVAARLNDEGFRTPRSRKGYTSTSVRKLGIVSIGISLG